MADMENYEVEIMEPAKGTYRGYQIISSPLPSSGGAHVIEALNIMENFDIGSMGFDSPERLHVMSEAFKMCFHDREEFMGDPAYVDVPINGILSRSARRSWRPRSSRVWQLTTSRSAPGSMSTRILPISPWPTPREIWFL